MNIVKLLTFWKKENRSYSSHLEAKYSLSTTTVVNRIKESLIKKSELFLDGEFQYQSLGGSNNFGFVIFTSCNKKNDWITKIAPEMLLRREALFFKYHKNNLKENIGFAPDCMGYGLFKETDLEFLTLERLDKAKNITSDQVFELYSRSENGQKLFDSGLLKEARELESGTRIKDILISLVCDFNSEKAKNYIDDFFIERIEKLTDYSDELRNIQLVVKRSYELLRDVDESLIGFVHGDFKGSNMMLDSSKQLRSIDFQYYCQGIRVWDLAFYFSKSKLSFSEGMEPILNKLSTENERKYLVFFYIFAVLLHLKPSALKKKKCKPALDYLNSK